MKTKALFHILAGMLTGLAVMSLSACNEKSVEPEPEPKPDPVIPVVDSHDRLVKVISTRAWDIDGYKNYVDTLFMAEAGVDLSTASVIRGIFFTANEPELTRKFRAEGSRNIRVEKVDYLYRTVAADGDSITLQGTVLFPCSATALPHQLDGITVYNHYAILYNAAAPTVSGSTTYARIAFNEAVIASDTEGYTFSSDRMPPFFNGLAKGRQTADAVIAAYEILESRQVTTNADAYTENFGSSLGAQQAIGVQKYIESDACPQWTRDLMPNLRTYATTGPIEPKEIFLSYTENDSIDFGYIPVMLVYTIFASYPDMVSGYGVEDFFEPGFKDVIVEQYGKKYRLFEAFDSKEVENATIRELIRVTYDDHMLRFLSPDMLDKEGRFNPDTPKSRIMLEALEKCSLADGWTPKHPLLINHSKDDEVIPYDKTYASYEKLAKGNDNVTFGLTFGAHKTATAIGTIRTTLMRHPSYNIEWAYTQIAGLIDDWNAFSGE